LYDEREDWSNFIGGAGTTIDGFSFFPYTQAMANVKVWVADKLPSNDSSDHP
jgi:hypothetical protein